MTMNDNLPNVTVIKVGGAVVEDPALLAGLLRGFCSVPGHKVLVHGGGRSATAVAGRMGVETRMVDGRRITDDSMLSIVTMVYGGLVNKRIVAQMQALGINALGMTGADLNIIAAHRRPATDTVDYGWVGDVDRADGHTLARLLREGITPVIAPLTHDGRGNLLNTNADTVATAVATALAPIRRVTLTFAFEKAGVLLRPDDDTSALTRLTLGQYQDLKARGAVSGGMLPKLDNAFAAIRQGVSRVFITGHGDLQATRGTTIE